ncbi:MAG: hypothetical protein GX180_02525 [Enterococcus sp.]|nr:hypothetical protein [Enterococcus sp.]
MIDFFTKFLLTHFIQIWIATLFDVELLNETKYRAAMSFIEIFFFKSTAMANFKG